MTNSDIIIRDLCDIFSIRRYTINVDKSIDVNQNVHMELLGLSKIPLVFNRVNGNFSIGMNFITSLKGCPREITGDFDIWNNLLNSLDHEPLIVGGDVNYSNNSLTYHQIKNIKTKINGKLTTDYSAKFKRNITLSELINDNYVDV